MIRGECVLWSIIFRVDASHEELISKFSCLSNWPDVQEHQGFAVSSLLVSGWVHPLLKASQMFCDLTALQVCCKFGNYDLTVYISRNISVMWYFPKNIDGTLHESLVNSVCHIFCSYRLETNMSYVYKYLKQLINSVKQLVYKVMYHFVFSVHSCS